MAGVDDDGRWHPVLLQSSPGRADALCIMVRHIIPATQDDVELRPRFKKAVSFGTKGVMAGLALAAALVLLVELKDRTMKTVSEVEKVTGLRVLAGLGDLDNMTAEEREAFARWLAEQRLNFT